MRDLAKIRFIPLARKLDFKEKLIKAYEETHLAALPEAPVYALQGISIKDAGLLRKAFHLETIEDLAGLKYFHWAKEIADAYEKGAEIDREIFSGRLVKKYANMPVNKLAYAPVSALHGISKNDEELIYRAFKIKTIKKFAELKYWRWACGIMELYASAAAEPEIPAVKRRIPLWMKVIIIFSVILSFLALIFFIDFKGIKQRAGEFFKAGISTSRGDVMPNGSSASTENLNLPDETEKNKYAEGYYTVQPGDSLISISIKLTGSYENWLKIYSENRDIIKNPQLLHPGQKLKIPQSLNPKNNKHRVFLFNSTGDIYKYYKALLYYKR